MTPIYLAAVIIGAPFVAFFVFSGFDLDVDADIDVDAGIDGLDVTDFLSLRSLVFLVAFFGVTGLLLTGLGAGTVVTLVSAIGIGVFAMWLNAKLVSLVRESEAGTDLTVEMIEGLPAEVVVPIQGGAKGKISLELDGRQVYLVAASFRGRDFGVGDDVVIVKLDRGAAFVASLDELD